MEVRLPNYVFAAGPVPQDWMVRPLGEIGKWYSGGTPSMSNSGYWEGEIPWASPKDMKVSRLYDTVDHISSKAVADGARILPKGAVLMVIRGMILAHSFPVARAERQLAFNQDIKAVVTDDDIDSNFFLHWLIGNAQKLRGLTTESTHGTKRLSPETLFRVPFPQPTKTEQKVIAEALSDANALIESLEQLIAKKRDLKQGAMQELLTGKKRLPGFTGEWITLRFDQLFTVHRNASNSRSELTENGGVAYVHYGDIHTYPSVFLNPIVLQTYIPRAKVRTVSRLEDGDLLMVDASEDTGAIGKAVEIIGLNDVEAVAGLHTIVLRGHKAYLANGFKGYIQHLPRVRSALVRLATGVSVFGITKSGVKTIEVTIPKPAEQIAIASILSDMDAEITALEDKLAKARQIKQGMMQELLTGRIRLL